MKNHSLRILAPTLLGLILIASALLVGQTASGAPQAPQPEALTAATTGWGSDWVAINPGQIITLTHNIGGNPDDYTVQLWFLDLDDGYGVNIRGYGGIEAGGHFYGAAWQNLNASTVQIIRHADDTFADRVFIRIWIPDPFPEYCSDWTTMTLGATRVFTHNVGGDVDDYSLGLRFRTSLGAGDNHRAYGGLETGGGTNFMGGYWYRLNDTTIQVYRHWQDSFAQQVRVCIKRPDPPAYDSGWVNIGTNETITFAHALGGSIGEYIVRIETNDTNVGGWGITHIALGGMVTNVTPEGMNWENLTPESIRVFSRGGVSDQVRVRIWKKDYTVYLPLVLNNQVTPVMLAYDDGVAESEQSQATLGSGFAVRFTPPTEAQQLTGAEFYLNAAAAGHPIEVHVWDTAHADLITPFATTPPAGMGWFTVDLAGYNLTPSGDFYVGFLYAAQHSDPSIGVDTSAPDGNSYEVPWEAVGSDYMIRVWMSP
ncbi:MAG: hypothetical protein ACP5J4_02440 [Anaerolineae bacterium]